MKEREGHPILKFKRLSKEATLPKYAHEGDAGFDICSIISTTIKKGESKVIPTGLASEIPYGFYVEVRDRSGLAANFGIHVLAGTIDAGYRGEWKIVLVNLGGKSYKVEKGERISQGVLLKVDQARIVEVKNLSDSERGEGGFGSTGRK